MIAEACAGFRRLFWLNIVVFHLRDHQSSSDELVWALTSPLRFRFYNGFASLGAGLGADLGLNASLDADLDVGLGCDRWALQQPLLVEKVQMSVCRHIDVAITRTLSFIVASHVSYD